MRTGDAGAEADALRFVVLGPVGFEIGGRFGTVRRAQARGQLGLLCLRVGQAVTFEAIAEAIWGGAAPATGRTQIHQAASVLRQQLAAAGALGVLAGGAFGYRLDVPPERVDAGLFDTYVQDARAAGGTGEALRLLRAGLRLWRGEPLGGATGTYVESARADLLERRMLAIETLAALELAAGRPDAALAELAPLTAANPLREPLRLLAMRALLAAGRRPDALATFRDYRGRLAEQEGLDPGDEITALMQEALGRPGPRLVTTPPLTGPARSAATVGPASRRPSTGDPRADAAVPVAVRATGSGAGVRRPAAARPDGPGRLPPAELPADPAGFAGRVAELAALDRVLTERDRGLRPSAVVAVVGPGGMGKTALAVRWAHAVADRFPDGALYVDLRGVGPGEPVDPAGVVERWLTAFGLDADRPSAAAAGRSEQLRTELAHRRVLLVLDNAASAAQVRELLPGAGGSAAVITSRHRLDALTVAGDAVRIELPRLPSRDAYALIRSVAPAAVAGARGPQLAALVRMCDGFPLALRIALGRLDGPRSLALPELLAGLADEDRRLQELAIGPAGDELAVATSFGASYARLSGGARRILHAVGLHFGPRPSVAACAAAAGVQPATARRALRELIDAHLLRWVGDDRVAGHDLLRLYARDRANQLTASERDRTVREVLDFYAAAAHAADRLLRPAGPHPAADRPLRTAPAEFADEAAALGWLDAEADNLVAAVRLGLPVAPAVAWRLCTSLSNWLMRRVPRTTWIELNGAAAEAAAAEGHRTGEALLVNGIGVAHALRRDVPAATAAFERAHRLRAEHGETRAAALTLINLAALLADTGEPARAIDHLLAARRIHLDRTDDRDLSTVDYNLGYAHSRAGRDAEATHWYEQARARAERIGYAMLVGHADIGLAEVYEQRGELVRAAEHYRRAFPALWSALDKAHLAWAAHGLGRVQIRLGQPAAAADNLRSALDLYLELGDAAAAEVRAQLTALDAATAC
ncbi:MAG TPA: BTAD domain-containing putative transcriptional regulator [Mycobacteriales bacterium]|nr:BTAD domain-containing putative transcriptional regulator [Mycobacteriales bacterium]